MIIPVELNDCCKRELRDVLRGFWYSIGPAADRGFILDELKKESDRFDRLSKEPKLCKMKVVYVAGKYSDTSKAKVEENIVKASKVSWKLMYAGFAPICPHKNSAHWENYISKEPEEQKKFWKLVLGIDLAIIKKCDTLYMLDNWKDSKGAKVEERYARLIGKEIIYQGTENDVLKET